MNDAERVARAIAEALTRGGRDWWQEGACYVVTFREEDGRLVVRASSGETAGEATVDYSPRWPHVAATARTVRVEFVPQPATEPRTLTVHVEDAAKG